MARTVPLSLQGLSLHQGHLFTGLGPLAHGSPNLPSVAGLSACLSHSEWHHPLRPPLQGGSSTSWKPASRPPPAGGGRADPASGNLFSRWNFSCTALLKPEARCLLGMLWIGPSGVLIIVPAGLLSLPCWGAFSSALLVQSLVRPLVRRGASSLLVPARLSSSPVSQPPPVGAPSPVILAGSAHTSPRPCCWGNG